MHKINRFFFYNYRYFKWKFVFKHCFITKLNKTNMFYVYNLSGNKNSTNITRIIPLLLIRIVFQCNKLIIDSTDNLLVYSSYISIVTIYLRCISQDVYRFYKNIRIENSLLSALLCIKCKMYLIV
jgi:hypothetical protein